MQSGGYFFLDDQLDRWRGPFDAAQLREMREVGVIDAHTIMGLEPNDPDWKFLRELAGFEDSTVAERPRVRLAKAAPSLDLPENATSLTYENLLEENVRRIREGEEAAFMARLNIRRGWSGRMRDLVKLYVLGACIGLLFAGLNAFSPFGWGVAAMIFVFWSLGTTFLATTVMGRY